MRAVVQRVSQARVTVDGEEIGAIGQGFLVLLGAEEGDDSKDVGYMARKILGLRVFPDEEGKMNRELAQAGGAVLAVSQFTLLGDCRKGKRPSFIKAARPERAKPLFEEFVHAIRAQGTRCETGRFQAMMEVELLNDGPVTLLLDSRKSF